jgi:hypothetical protein
MSVEQNITVVSRLMEEVVNQAQVHILDEVMAPAYLEHAGLMKGKSVAREDLKQIIWHFRSAFPVWLETIEYLIAQDNLVFRRVLCHGTNQPVEKVSKVELGNITVRMGDESSTLICYGKMFSKNERPLTNQQC